MKRDMDLVRKILQWMEAQEHGSVAGRKVAIDGYTQEQIGYHAYLMHEAGLIFAVNVPSTGLASPRYLPVRLTWAGHDFLESVKDDGLWEKAKKNVIQPAGGVAFSVLVDWARAEAKTRLGIP